MEVEIEIRNLADIIQVIFALVFVVVWLAIAIYNLVRVREQRRQDRKCRRWKCQK